MGQFGGWGKFGGSFQFGGSTPHAEIYYRVLKSLGPPGLRPSDDDLLTNYLLRADCTGLQHGLILAERFFAEMFPHTAEENLPEWETLLDVVPAKGATVAERRDAVVARWRGSAGCSLLELRAIFHPLLNPTKAWRDDFLDDSVSYRWDVAGNGTVTEGFAVLNTTATAGANCLLDGSSTNGKLCTRRVNDIADGWRLDAVIANYSVQLNTAAGIIAFRDYENFYMLCFAEHGAGARLEINAIIEGVQTVDVGGVGIAAPAPITNLQIERTATEMVFRYGANPFALTELHRIPLAFAPRHVGFFARNEQPALNQAFVYSFRATLTHANPVNNVEIIETTSDETAISGNESDIFFAFIHRDPTDAGTYDILNAQRQADKAKQAHTLITVGESDIFLTDDLFSLTDRDILGS